MPHIALPDLGSLALPPPLPDGHKMDPLRYILPVEDAEYQQVLSVRSQMLQVSSSAGAGAALGLPAFSRWDGLNGSLGLMVAFLMLSFLFNSLIAALTRRHSQNKERQQLIDKVEEEVWVTLGGTLLLVAGWQCLFSVGDHCGLHSTAGCLRNWPLIPIEANVHKYYNVELGWYLQLMLKHVMGEQHCTQQHGSHDSCCLFQTVCNRWCA
eukprot:GHRQ01024382.1.p1 GENE.GHRQ01024382.1~~GHRQ01024382.1.p1  ORF type:complete len:223 (+),score=41.14 GHRQ01024382.1:41-670(+)